MFRTKLHHDIAITDFCTPSPLSRPSPGAVPTLKIAGKPLEFAS
jgi:hypothetical protein